MTHEDLLTLFDRALRQRDIHDLIAVAQADPECYVERRDWYTRRDPREVAYEVVDRRTNTGYTAQLYCGWYRPAFISWPQP